VTFDSRRFQSEYPFESRWFDRGGVRMHYLDEGAGEPVVMVHGNPTWSFYFRELVKAMRGRYRCVVPDHIGCGLSDKPGDEKYEYRLRRRIEDLDALLESLGVNEDITLVLHDWGGAIGMGYAARHPERIRRIVLLNTAAFHLPSGKRIPFTLRLARNSALGALLVRGFNAFSFGATFMATTKEMAPEIRRAYRAPYDSWQNRIATLRFVQDIPLSAADRSYADIEEIQNSLEHFRDRPALICWGGRDFVFDGDFLSEWRRRWPQAEVHEFPEAGHYVLEDAGDQIIPLIQGFLAAHPIAAGVSA
jgi:pimeloyl-ACP methyl ester carboxylesterase